MKENGSKFITMIAVLGAFASILGAFNSIRSLQHSPSRTAQLVFFLLLFVTASIIWLSQEVNLFSACSILRTCKRLGIKKIHQTGKSTSHLSEHIAEAGTIKIMAISAQTLIKQHKQEIIKALCDRNAAVCVLLAQPNSDFVGDVEESESSARNGQISPEIEQAKKLLSEYLNEAAKKAGRKVGTFKVGHYGTHLRCSLVLCDDKWGWLTLNLPPKRAIETASFELTPTAEGLLTDCKNHFDTTWKIAEKKKNVQTVELTDSV
jgi:hypothetical protein